MQKANSVTKKQSGRGSFQKIYIQFCVCLINAMDHTVHNGGKLGPFKKHLQ